LGAIGATYLLIKSGVDAKVERWAEKQSLEEFLLMKVPLKIFRKEVKSSNFI
jgi:hypothetical protein